MDRQSTSAKMFWAFVVCVLCAVSMWTYAERVLITHQLSYAAIHGNPRGNLSDLYPRWLGARELLLHGRDPYSAEITREIQTGYYGRPLDPSRPEDPIDQQAFAYPAYLVFYLAPTIHLDFAIVQKTFFWILIGLTLASIPLWLRVLSWPVPPSIRAVLMVLTLGSLPVLQGLKLQQLTLLVAAMLALAMALLVTERPIAAGILLALATIKPQLVLPLLLWLAIWSLGDLKRRYRWAVSFLVVMAILCAGAEFWLPHWIARFWHAAAEYRHYTRATPILGVLLPHPWDVLLEALFAAATAFVCWKQRKYPENTGAFQSSTCLVLALTVLELPTFSLYNQALLLPAILIVVRDQKILWERNLASRCVMVMVAVMLAWPWLSSTVLGGLSFVLRQETIQRAWAIPEWTVLHIPASVTALMLLHYYQRTFPAPAGQGSS